MYKKFCHKKKQLKFEDYKNCLEATKLEKKIAQLQKHKFNIDRLRKNHKKQKAINWFWNLRKKFRSKKHNVLLKEVNKISLRANNNK